jgi:peptidoglycan hydrolase-like protein with peptidoglycan-binding domain
MLRWPRFSSSLRLQEASRNDPPMKMGEYGDAVMIVQNALMDLGYWLPATTGDDVHMPDGMFDRETETMVRRFQASKILPITGVVDRRFLVALEDEIWDQVSARARRQAAFFR